ncbi:hypothetical protein FACS189494_07980 [Spirochaetia bacterium]|nr:hypothetical protein FACS189494_07980 [Spirochaetia bacterium]
MLKTLLQITRPDSLNIISPIGLGDTMLISGVRHILEKQYGCPVHLIIKESHRIVLEMYNNTGYSIHEFSEDELYGIGKNNPVPQKGLLYVAHPTYSDNTGIIERFCKGDITHYQVFLNLFNIKDDSLIRPPAACPRLTNNMMAKLNFALPDINRTALLLPESRSVAPLSADFWKKTAEELRQEGFFLVQSYTRNEFGIEGVNELPDDLNTVIAFAASCAKVYSVRSGLCDLIAAKVKSLTIYFPSPFHYNAYRIFGRNIENILVNGKTADAARNAAKHKRASLLKQVIKKLPPAKQITNRFNDVNKRIQLEEQKAKELDRRIAELYNDMLMLTGAKV